MSKFLDKLEQTMSAKSQPMGFAAAASRPRGRPMLILARLPKADAALAELALAEKVDGCLLDQGQGQDLKPTLEVLGEVPWGMALEAADGLGQLQEKGCDFLVVTPSIQAAPLLQDEEMGFFLEVDESLPDNLVRAIEHLPVAALVLRKEVTPLTMHRWLELSRLSLLSGCPLFIPCARAVTGEELGALWQAGVRGLVVDLGETAVEEIRGLVKAVDTMELPSRKGREHKTAFLPPISLAEEEMGEEPD